MHGIREFANRSGARVCYVGATPDGGLDPSTTKVLNLVPINSSIADVNVILQTVLSQNRPESGNPSLFVLTAQSNISNSKNPLSLINDASSLGYHVLLDAAALAPTSIFSLAEYPVDAMALSFYKMFGFPTGVGALVVKKSFLRQLKRPWFAGGTVDIVQVPGSLVMRSDHIHEQFEVSL